MLSFIEKLHAIQTANRSRLALTIAPRIEKVPLPVQKFDEPFFPLGKAIINATHNRVAAYVFDLPAYMALGAAGMIALERTIDYVGRDVITILHGAFGRDDFAIVWDENAFGVDAVTLAHGQPDAPYTTRADRAAFCAHDNVPDGRLTPTWWRQHNLLTAQGLTLKLLSEAVVYSDRGEHFSESLRAQVEGLADADA